MYNFYFGFVGALVVAYGWPSCAWSTSLSAAVAEINLGRDGLVLQKLLSPADQISLYALRLGLSNIEIARRLGISRSEYLVSLANHRRFGDPLPPALADILQYDPQAVYDGQLLETTARERFCLYQSLSKISAKQLASRVGVKPHVIESLMSKKLAYQLSRELAEKLAAPLNCSPDDIVSEPITKIPAAVEAPPRHRVALNAKDLSHLRTCKKVFPPSTLPILRPRESRQEGLFNGVLLARHPLQDQIEGRFEIPLSWEDQQYLNQSNPNRRGSFLTSPSERLALYAHRMGWSNADLSNRSQIHPTSIWRYLNFASSHHSLTEHSYIHLDTAKALASALGCPHQDLVYDPRALSRALLEERLERFREWEALEPTNENMRDFARRAQEEDWSPAMIFVQLSLSIGSQSSQLIYDFDRNQENLPRTWMLLNRAANEHTLPQAPRLIKAYRLRLSLPMDGLQRIWGVNGSAVKHIESGQKMLTVQQAARYAYGVQLSSVETLALVRSYYPSAK